MNEQTPSDSRLRPSNLWLLFSMLCLAGCVLANIIASNAAQRYRSQQSQYQQQQYQEQQRRFDEAIRGER